MKTRTRRSLRLGGFALLLLIAAGVALWQLFGSDPAADAIPVTVEAARITTLQTRVVGSCEFRPRRGVTVITDTGGRVAAIPAAVGDTVRPGQTLLVFEDRDLRVALLQAELGRYSAEVAVRRNLANLRSTLRTAESASQRARATLERQQGLYGAGSVTRDELDRAEQEEWDAAETLRSAREQLNLAAGTARTATPGTAGTAGTPDTPSTSSTPGTSGAPLAGDPPTATGDDSAIVDADPDVIRARLAEEQAALDLSRATVVAPLAGTLTGLGVSLGNHAAPGTAVATVETLDDILAQVQIDEVDIGKIRIGQHVLLTSDSVRDAELTGRISLVPPTMDNHVVVIQVDVDEGGLPAGTQLRAGASCRARIEAELKRDATAVPFAALLERPGGSVAFVATTVEEGAELHRLERREVELGVSSVNEVEVTAGVAAGELVVVGNLSLLRDGLMVTLEQGTER